MTRETSQAVDRTACPTPAPTLFVSCSRCRTLYLPQDERALDPICDACRLDEIPSPRAIVRFHPLSDEAIADTVRERSPGNYALGYFDGSGFTAFFVGRSDSDVSACLHDWVGVPSCPGQRPSSRYEPWRSRSGPLALGTRALGRIAVGVDTPYTHFACCYAPTALAAFERECRDFHELGGSDGLDNRCHPQPPPGSPWLCPFHGSLG